MQMRQVTVFPVHLHQEPHNSSMYIHLVDQNNNSSALVLAKDVDPSEKVGATKFRIGQLLEWMAQSGDPGWLASVVGRRLVEVRVEQVSGIGFLSYIYRILVYFEGIKTPFSVILKVPSVVSLSLFSKDSDFLSNWAYKLSDRHNKEIFFYQNFGRHISATGIVHIPKLFHAIRAETPLELENGCILMEDLDRQGIMGNIVGGLSRMQIEDIIRVLGRIHALSLAIPGSSQLLEQFSFKFSLDEKDGQAKFNAVNALIGIGHDYWKRHGAQLKEIAAENELMLLESHKLFGVPPVLCHGDMWANNVFFERLPDGSAGQKLFAFIDWQFAQPNSGLQDVARLVLLCANSTDKLRHLDSWLKLYYVTFADACRKWGVKCPYSMDLVRQMFLAHYPSEMLFSIVILIQQYARMEKPELKTALLGRMISSFEWFRKKERKGNGLIC